MFSPNGRKLATLTSDGNGRTGLVVWDLLARNRKEFLEINVDLYVKFSDEMREHADLAEVLSSWSQYVWADDESILFVDQGKSPPQFDEAIETATDTYATLRKTTAEGQPSVRVWKANGPTCGVGRNLMRLSCETGHTLSLYDGDIRGLSLSPDGKRLATLVAKDHIRYSTNRPMETALRATSNGDDPLVALSLLVIDTVGILKPIVVEEFDGVGNVSPPRLPAWNNDGSCFAVASRSIYSSEPSTDNDSVFEVNVENFGIRKRRARSALDAELLVALITCIPESHKEAAIDTRPRVPSSQETASASGQLKGGAWKCGNRTVIFWAGQTITLIGPDKISKLPDQYSMAYAPVSVGDHASMLVVRTDGTKCQLSLFGVHASIQEHALTSDWEYLATRRSDGALVAKSDTMSGTNIAAFAPGHPITISPLQFNRNFNELQQPPRREVTCLFGEGDIRTGILQLPVGRSSKNRHPVVVWAYPDQQPSINGPMTRLNHVYAVYFPMQYLLTRGFAVFHAPFPTKGKHAGHPLRMAVDAVVPWLDILDQQPEIIPGEYAFFGHSNGGYAALALEVATKRFKCIAASSTFPDLAVNPLASSMDKMVLDCAGPVIQADRRYYEDATQPYTFDNPLWVSEQTHLENSPLYLMNDATTPLLLIEGEFDFSPREMESTYSILYGRDVPVELAYYWGEGHVISSPGNIKDVWTRTERFFQKYLKMSA